MSRSTALDAAEQVLAQLVLRAESSRHCPYRAADARCTAAFGCRNQRRRGDERVCVASADDLDWRAAWQVSALALRRARS